MNRFVPLSLLWIVLCVAAPAPAQQPAPSSAPAERAATRSKLVEALRAAHGDFARDAGALGKGRLFKLDDKTFEEFKSYHARLVTMRERAAALNKFLQGEERRPDEQLRQLQEGIRYAEYTESLLRELLSRQGRLSHNDEPSQAHQINRMSLLSVGAIEGALKALVTR